MGDETEKDWGKVRAESADAPQENTENGEEDNLDFKQESLTHPSYEALEEKLTQAEQEAFENKEKCMRALAEVDNVRRRAERDVTNAHRYALEKFVDSLLPVMDSLEQGLELAKKDADGSMIEGTEMTMKLFLDVLEKHKVKQFNPVGDKFDPQIHEAMSIQPTADVAPNTVMAVFQKGYLLNDRVIRPARVVVAKEEK